MKQAILYSLKVWLTTVALSSFISMVVQSFILLPNYHLPNITNRYYDWLLQLAGTTLVNAILLFPMGIMFLAMVVIYKKRNLSLKTRRCVIVILVGIIPDLGFMWYEITSKDIIITKANGIGMMLNLLTCILIAIICVSRFKLDKGSNELLFNLIQLRDDEASTHI